MRVKEFLDHHTKLDILQNVWFNQALVTQLVTDAENEDLLRMLRIFRNTQYHDVFLRSLFDLPLGIWSEHDLKAEDILRELEPEDKKKLLRMYWASAEFKQNPIIELLLLEG